MILKLLHCGSAKARALNAKQTLEIKINEYRFFHLKGSTHCQVGGKAKKKKYNLFLIQGHCQLEDASQLQG